MKSKKKAMFRRITMARKSSEKGISSKMFLAALVVSGLFVFAASIMRYNNVNAIAEWDNAVKSRDAYIVQLQNNLQVERDNATTLNDELAKTQMYADLKDDCKIILNVPQEKLAFEKISPNLSFR